MTAAAAAHHFYAFHIMRGIVGVNDAVGAECFEEAGPAAFAGKFAVGAKQRIAAHDAIVGADARVIPVLSGESPFRAFFPRYFVDAVGKDFFPFGVGYVQFGRVCTGVVRVFG